MSIGVKMPTECKRNHSIFVSEDFINALKKCFNWGQSEKLPDNSHYPLYIGEELIEQMRSPDNQIIWGRRGTGKTHLLRAFTQRINEDAEICDIAYYISCNNIKYETPVDINFTDDVQQMKYLARESYKNFLTNLVEQIIDTYNKYLNSKYVFSEKDYDQKEQIIKNVDNYLAWLLDICTTGIPRIVEKGENNISKRLDKKSRENEIGIGVKASIRNPISLITHFINFICKGRREKETSISNQIDTKTVYEFSFLEIQKTLADLLSAMKINTLYLSIDELWLVDDKNTISFQPIFLDYLRQTFFGQNKISVKIASIRETTKLNSKNSMHNCFGLQSGHDIFELADLDLMHTNDENISRKFEDILTMRVNFFSELFNNNDLYDKSYSYDSEYIIKTLFKNKRYFEILISLSHGIPRNFLHILQVCLASIYYNIPHHFLHVYLISEVVMAIYMNDRRSNMPMNKNSVYSMINDYCVKNKELFFIISTEQVKRINVEINNLLYTEIIHRIPSSMTPISIMDTYKAYFIDTGKYFHTLKEYDQIEYGSKLSNFILTIPSDIKQNYLHYVIDLDNVKIDFIECPNCSAIINKAHPVYKKFNCCYTCSFQMESMK